MFMEWNIDLKSLSTAPFFQSTSPGVHYLAENSLQTPQNNIFRADPENTNTLKYQILNFVQKLPRNYKLYQDLLINYQNLKMPILNLI